MVRRIAVNDRCFRQELAEFLAPRYITLNDLDLHSQFAELRGEIIRHSSAAADNDFPDLSFMLSKHAEETLHLNV